MTNPQYVTPVGDYLYVSSFPQNKVWKCSQTVATGALSCADSGGVFPGSNGVQGTRYDSGYMYVSMDPINKVYSCKVQANGDLANCQDSGATGLGGPLQIRFL